MKEKGLQIIHYQEGHERIRKIKIRNISAASFSTSADQKSCSNVAENADDIGRYADNTDNISSANNDQNHAQNTVADDVDDMNDIIHDFTGDLEIR